MTYRRHLGGIGVGALFLVISATSALGTDVAPGSKIRLRTYYHPAYVTGEFMEYAADSVYVRVDGEATPRAFASWRLASIQVSTGQRLSLSRGALIGGAVGIIFGSIAGTLATDSEPCPPEGCLMDNGDTNGPVILGVSTAAGIVLGMITAKVLGESWQPVSPAQLGRADAPRIHALAYRF